VTVGAVLVAYAAFVGTLGSRMLSRARWTARAPLLGIVTPGRAGCQTTRPGRHPPPGAPLDR